MRPELFVIPFLNVSIKSYGFMMVIGFVSAMYLARWLAKCYRENPETISDFTVYAMIAGVIGARIFHVIHYYDQYRDNLLDIFKLWLGGLEFLGGFLAALAVMIVYLRRKRLGIMKYMDILAPALMLGLAFGRIGCLMNGCCFGKTTDSFCAITFPVYNTYTDFSLGVKPTTRLQYSHPYNYQIHTDFQRRPGQPPIIDLPDDYFDQGFYDADGHWIESLDQVPASQRQNFHPERYVKPPGELTPQQLDQMQHGPYCMHPIHPTQLYSVVKGLSIMTVLLLLHRRRFKMMSKGQPIAYGAITSVMLIFYGIARFVIEYFRADNPIEFTGLTISQNLSILAVLGGLGLLAWSCHVRRLETSPPNSSAR